MSMTAEPDSFFVVGGPVQPDRPCYVSREADRELLAALRAGDYCHVLAPHQVGKSSLMAQAAWRLRGDGVDVAALDLAEIGGRTVADDVGRWYYSFAWRVMRELRLRADLTAWWQERSGLTIRQRLRDFFLEQVLALTRRPVVILLDRVEVAAARREAWEVFDAVRGCLDARATEPECRRLAFALLGTTGIPRELLRRQDSPFSVSTPIALGDFTPDELMQLVAGLPAGPDTRSPLAGRIWHWTAGHPYLSQKLCRALAREAASGLDAAAVDRVAERLFGGRNALREDSHLGYLAARLRRESPRRAARLTLYGRVRMGMRVPVEQSVAAQRELLDLGLLVDADGSLAVRNRVYAAAFTPLWVNRNLPFSWQSIAVAFVVLVLALAIPVWYRDYLPRPYIRTLKAERQEFVAAREAWQRLRFLPGFATEADLLFTDYLVRQGRRATRLPEVQRIGERLAELPGGEERSRSLLAEFWERRSNLMAQRGDRDAALAYALQPPGEDSPRRLARVGELIATGMAGLEATIRPGKPLADVAVDPDSGLVTTLDEDHEIAVWRLDGGSAEREQRLDLAAGLEPGRSLASALGPAGRRALSWPVDAKATAAELLVWDVARARPLARLPRPAGMRSARFALGHGAVLLVGDRDIELRDAVSGGLLRRMALDPEARAEPVLSADGRFLVAETGGRLTVWDLRALKAVGNVPVRGTAPLIAVDAPGRQLAVGDGSRRLRVWRVADASLLADCLHAGVPQAAVFDPGGRWLAVQDDTGRLRVWDLEGGCRPLLGRRGSGPWQVVFSPDGAGFAAGHPGRGYEFFALPGGGRVGEAIQPGMSTAGSAPASRAAAPGFLPGSAMLRTYDGRKAVKLWSVPWRSTSVSAPLAPLAEEIAVSGDGTRLALGTHGGDVRIERLGAAGAVDLDPDPGPGFVGHADAVTKLEFAPGGAVLGSGSLDGGVRLWDVATGVPRRFFATHTDGAVQDLAFLPDGSAIVSASARSVLAIDAASGTVLARLPIEASQPALAITPDGVSVFVAGDRDGLTRWDWRRDAAIPLGGEAYRLRRLAMGPDGQLLATAGADRVVRLWRPQAGAPLRRVFTAGAPVHDLWFGREGRTLMVHAGVWLHALEVQAAGLVARSSRPLPDADSHVAPVAGGGLVVLSAAGTVRPRLWRLGENAAWAKASPGEFAPDRILERLRLGVTETGEVRPLP